MTQDTTCERRPPTRYGQKGKLISVGDEVKVRYVKTDDYWIVKVLTIEGDGMTVQWIEDVGPSSPVKVPLGHVYELGTEGGYGDNYSAIRGTSSGKSVGSKRKRVVPQATEFTWALEDVTKIVVTEASWAYEDSPVVERTMLTFTYIIKTGGTWVRQLHKAIGLMQVIQDDTT